MTQTCSRSLVFHGLSLLVSPSQLFCLFLTVFYNMQHRKLGCSKQRCEEATCEDLMNKRAQRCPVRGTRSFIQCKGRPESQFPHANRWSEWNKPGYWCVSVSLNRPQSLVFCVFLNDSCVSVCVCVNARAASTSTAQLERKWTSPSNELWQAVDATLLAWKRSFCLVWLTICGGSPS